jgi:hypothetical protein
VYVLPAGDATHEDLQWLAREIAAEGGEATVCTATFVEGLRDEQVEALFHAARDANYVAVTEEARALARDLPPRLAKSDERRPALEAEVARLRKRIDEIAAIDFFGSLGREPATSSVAALERRVRSSEKKPGADDAAPLSRSDYRGRTWVTRKNIHVDRIASAWLIRRFIDEDARFKFVPSQGYRAAPRELTFDMADGVFTHVGDACTFETLVTRFALAEPGLAAIAEIVHDIDVKDGKFARPEGPGIAALVAGIAVAHADDEKRIEIGGAMFDALAELYGRKKGRGGVR